MVEWREFIFFKTESLSYNYYKRKSSRYLYGAHFSIDLLTSFSIPAPTDSENDISQETVSNKPQDIEIL